MLQLGLDKVLNLHYWPVVNLGHLIGPESNLVSLLRIYGTIKLNVLSSHCTSLNRGVLSCCDVGGLDFGGVR